MTVFESVCTCVSMICVHRRNSENISKVFLWVLHLAPKLGLFSLSGHTSPAISASQNHKVFKGETAEANPVIFSLGNQLRPIGPALLDEWATRRQVPGCLPARGAQLAPEGLDDLQVLSLKDSGSSSIHTSGVKTRQ